MTDESNSNNSRRNWLSRDTFVPWSAAVAFASLAAWGSYKYGDIERTISSVAANSAAQVKEESSKVALELQSLRMTVEYQGRDLAELKKSVDALNRVGGK